MHMLELYCPFSLTMHFYFFVFFSYSSIVFSLVFTLVLIEFKELPLFFFFLTFVAQFTPYFCCSRIPYL